MSQYVLTVFLLSLKAKKFIKNSYDFPREKCVIGFKVNHETPQMKKKGNETYWMFKIFERNTFNSLSFPHLIHIVIDR